MAELIDKKSALNALNDVSYGNFNYVTARNAIDCIRTTTEAEIRAKAKAEAYDEFAEKLKECFRWDSMFNKYYAIGKIDKIADQLKEE